MQLSELYRKVRWSDLTANLIFDTIRASKPSLETMGRLAAHASIYHWLHAGTEVHHQRGEWLISKVQAVLGNGTEALR